MRIILKLLIIGMFLTAHMALALPQLKAAMPHVPNAEGLAGLIMNAHLSGTDPERAMKCFTDYIQESNRISSQYSIGYRSCIETSRSARYRVDLQVTIERRGIVSEADVICKRLTHCNMMKNSLSLFNCHAEVGSNNTESSYIISANASDFAITLQESYRTISLREDKCCGVAERNYVENTTGNYRFLQRCLTGRGYFKPTNLTTSEPSMTEPHNTLGWTSGSNMQNNTNTPRPATLSTATESTPQTTTTTISAASSPEPAPSPIPEENANETTTSNI